MTDDFKDMSLVIHGGKEDVAVALVRLRRAIERYLVSSVANGPPLKRLIEEIEASRKVVEDRNEPTPN